MATQKDLDRLVSLLVEQAVTEHHAVRVGGLEVSLWTVFRPPMYPSLPKRLRPLWMSVKGNLANLAVKKRENLGPRIMRRIRSAGPRTNDGYTQSPLL